MKVKQRCRWKNRGRWCSCLSTVDRAACRSFSSGPLRTTCLFLACPPLPLMSGRMRPECSSPGSMRPLQHSLGPPMSAISISKPSPFTAIIPSKAIVKWTFLTADEDKDIYKKRKKQREMNASVMKGREGRASAIKGMVMPMGMCRARAIKECMGKPSVQKSPLQATLSVSRFLYNFGYYVILPGSSWIKNQQHLSSTFMTLGHYCFLELFLQDLDYQYIWTQTQLYIFHSCSWELLCNKCFTNLREWSVYSQTGEADRSNDKD